MTNKWFITDFDQGSQMGSSNCGLSKNFEMKFATCVASQLKISQKKKETDEEI